MSSRVFVGSFIRWLVGWLVGSFVHSLRTLIFDIFMQFVTDVQHL